MGSPFDVAVSAAIGGKRFTTFERVEINMPAIVKRTGVRREYDRDKVRGSMRLRFASVP